MPRIVNGESPSILRAIVLACLMLGWAGCAGSPDGSDGAADLVLRGGKIVTLDETLPEAQALAAKDGRIVAVGSNAEMEGLVGPSTQVIDLAGQLAIPGFIEGHGHFTGLGWALMNVGLRDADTWQEVVRRAAEAAGRVEPGQWIEGRGWHQDKWTQPPRPSVEGYPTHAALSQAVPDHPVLFRHASGHAVLVNAKAMELAGIDRNTPDPPGGTILRDSRGNPTGVLREKAANVVQEALSRSQAEQRAGLIRQQIALADRECLANGITSFQDAGSDFDTIDLLREAAEGGKLGVRLWVMIRDSNENLEAKAAQYRVTDLADHRFTVGGIKRSIDGALGSHGAWLLKPYTDLPESTGLNTVPLDTMSRTAEIALANDYQLCVHAIGDRANRETLDLFERVFEAAGDNKERRWRIEHAQHLHPDDIDRFAELGVVASMQSVHCTSDGPWVPTRLGRERTATGAYVWRKLIESGAVVSNGTDAPVEDINPLANFHSAVTRLMSNGEAFYPDQRMTRLEALRSYTIHAAYAAFEEDTKGTLTPGKLADVVVLSKDILEVPEDEIPDTEVVYTIVGGELLHNSKS